MSPEAVELDIHIHNDFALWKMHESVEAALAKKIVRGDYNPDLAVKAWLNLVDRAARSYAKDNRMPSRAFANNLRRELATEFERRFYRKHMGMRKSGLDALRAVKCSNCGGHHQRSECPNIDYRRIDRENPVTYGCGECGVRFKSMNDLIAHQEVENHPE